MQTVTEHPERSHRASVSGRARDVVLNECFARDGLQHEPDFVATERKVALIDRFSTLGFTRIEATSFTHPVNVPQFTDADAVLRSIARAEGAAYKATCVNLKSIERANRARAEGFGPDEISVVMVASKAMLARAFKRAPEEQDVVIGKMIDTADRGFRIIGTISAALGCPFEGAVDPHHVMELARWLADRGIDHIAIGDTTGLGNPATVRDLFKILSTELPQVTLIAHFHDTRGLGLANCMAAYEAGARHFDCAFGGAGGNPAKIAYAEGYTGNVCTEDLVNMFETMGLSTGLDLAGILETARLCEATLGRELLGRVTRSGFGSPLETRIG